MKDDSRIAKKKELRRQMTAQRERLSLEQQEEEAILICRRIVDHPSFNQSKTILFYMPFRGEVDVRPAIEAAWKEEKKVVLPRVVLGEKRMTLWQIESFHDVERGSYGILEPKQREEAWVNPAKIDLVIVPGVAFDLAGYRLGYGGGYYDRFFAKWKSALRIGVGYSFQIVPTVYPEAHDQSLHGLITLEKVMNFH